MVFVSCCNEKLTDTLDLWQIVEYRCGAPKELILELRREKCDKKSSLFAIYIFIYMEEKDK